MMRNFTNYEPEKNEKLFQTIFNSMSEGIVLIDSNGVIEKANPAAEEILGLNISNIEGRMYDSPDWKIIRPDGTSMPVEEMPGPIAMKEKKSVNNVMMGFVKYDHSISWINVSAVPIISQDGSIDKIIGTFVDITEKKNAEDELRDSKNALEREVKKQTKALRESNEKLKKREQLSNQILESISDGFFTLNNELVVKYFNNEAEKLLGRNREDVLGRQLFEAFPEAKGSIFEEKYSLGVKEKKFISFETYFGIRPYENWYDVRIYPFEDGITVFFQVITERIVAQQIKSKLEEQLQQSQKMEAIGTLAGGIAHDFNNMLGVITGNLSYALSILNKDNELYDVLNDIQLSSKQAQSLTQQLLTFSKGGSPIKKLTDINRLIENSAIFSSRGTTANCCFKLSDHLWATEVDEGQINQVIGNLIINANQAMPNGGTITIRTENEIIDSNTILPLPLGNYIKIEVEDQGKGISKKHLPNIFEPYFTTKQKGTGLGLTSTYSIIKKHGGHIDVYSELDKGTVFKIYLPSSDQNINESKKVQRQKHNGLGKILIMDDQEAILKMIGRMLSSMGYEAEFATDGVEAIEKYKQGINNKNPFDIVILDLTVPGGMGGAKAIIEFLKIDPNIKALVSSGYSNDPIMANYEEYGFIGVIPKPYTKALLTDVLTNIFNLKD